ncbi:MAG: citrate (Si)-synthase [Deltaproteobacteria bacterium]|nr:citrate (Si)-synthase [Deltaproteobacteria bacterium]
MNDNHSIINKGLRGVTVASTKISDVDGQAGKLIYRGYLVQDLAERTSFEEIAHLLLFEKLPDEKELESFTARLKEARDIPREIIEALKTRPADSLPMDILQSSIPMIANHDSDIGNYSLEACQNRAVSLIAKFPGIIAAWERIRNGKDIVPPNVELGHAANFLYMLKGETPDDDVEHFFDVGLVLHAEHSFNASTFAAREVASTRAHMYAAVTAGVGSLSGELHGGANVRVMEMLKRIGSVDKVEYYINRELDAGRVIFGLGHAVYKTDDPRALILAPMAEIMCKKIGEPHWYDISKRLEEKSKAAFKQRKGIDIFLNVDFFSASLYYAMGIPTDLFTPVFAISRIAGWTAHVLEEQFAGAAAKPALYRPESDYIGDYCGPEECVFTPMGER